MSALNVIFILCEVLIAIVSILGNSVIIFVFHREKKLRIKSNYYLFSLAVADWGVGCFGILLTILYRQNLPENVYGCTFTICIITALNFSSIFSLVAVCLDRYFMIVLPKSNYSTNKSPKSAFVSIAMCWIIGIFIAMLPAMGWRLTPEKPGCRFVYIMDKNYTVLLLVTTTFIPILILIFSYGSIFMIVWRQGKKMHQITVQNQPREHLGADDSSYQKEIKLAKTLTVIIATFVVCWAPLQMFSCFMAICPSCKMLSRDVFEFLIVMTHLHSAINPFLYAFHIRNFKSSIKTLLPKCMKPDVILNAQNLNRTTQKSDT